MCKKMFLTTDSFFGTGAELCVVSTGVLVVSGLLSSLSSSILARLSAIALMLHISTLLTTTLLVPMIAPYHQSPGFVWTKFYGIQYSSSGITSNLYLFMQVGKTGEPAVCSSVPSWSTWIDPRACLSTDVFVWYMRLLCITSAGAWAPQPAMLKPSSITALPLVECFSTSSFC